MTKFALLSHILPPSPTGQAVMLYRILSGIQEDNYYLINTRNHLSPGRNRVDERFRLGGKYYSLPPEPTINHRYHFGWSWILKVINIFIRLYARTRNVLGILRCEPNTSAILVCTGDLVDIPAGFLVSRICRIPFYAYIFDDYLYQFIGSERWAVKLISPYIFKHSAGIIGPNEFICQEYQRRYGVTAAMVRNPCDKTELEKEPYNQTYGPKSRIKILFTGDVYLANYDCFRNLIQAMKSLLEYPLELHIFTARIPEQLANEGIQSDKTFIHPHLTYSEVLEQQRMSDILFLPLAFESPIPEIIRTSAPGKLGEYLASGRPVLAHVPANSFVAHYLEKNQCGLVASENDPASLKNHILKLINDEGFCRATTHHARQRAKQDFDPQISSEKLVDFLSTSMRKNPG
jgi:glycosyltransferase involved in cell wall biosynthesis